MALKYRSYDVFRDGAYRLRLSEKLSMNSIYIFFFPKNCCLFSLAFTAPAALWTFWFSLLITCIALSGAKLCVLTSDRSICKKLFDTVLKFPECIARTPPKSVSGQPVSVHRNLPTVVCTMLYILFSLFQNAMPRLKNWCWIPCDVSEGFWEVEIHLYSFLPLSTFYF